MATETPRTVKVRIAVAVLSDGRYVADGWRTNRRVNGQPRDKALREAVLENLYLCCDLDENPERPVVHFVTAEIPLPEPPPSLEVEGEAEGG